MKEPAFGQLTIFDIHEDEKKRRPCEYGFQRYVGQRVRVSITSGVKHGKITKIGPYYTDVLTDEGYLIAATPYNTSEEKEGKMQEPCHRICDVGWCSLSCFLRRGYMRGPDEKWLRNDDGTIMIANHPECDWKPHERTKEEMQEWYEYCDSFDKEKQNNDRRH